MKFGKFNITNMIKAGMILIFALMLNIAGLNNSSAQGYNPRPVTTMGAYAPTASEVVVRSKPLDAAQGCYAEVYRAQHTGGCWSCLVIERLTSAFLNVAKHALPVTQKAGVILLVLGTVLWLLKWGLTNVSSFNEVQNANILNSLFKMCFKVMLAYWCIIYSTNVISQYFIRPIMSVGAIIGQNMWGEEIKETAIPWDDLSDMDITESVKKSEMEQQKEVEKQEAKETEDVDKETLDELDARIEKDRANGSQIPAFQMPGTNGSITSFPGCRIPPPTNQQTNCGSFSHMGLDIGASAGSPIWAIAEGSIVYSSNSGWGNMAVITTKHKGSTWTHLYAHMNDADWNKYKQYHATKGYKVARGEIIGGVGSTGQSSGPHLHLELVLSGTIDGKTYNNDIIEPISLSDGKIVVRGRKNGSPTGAVNKSSCTCGQNGNPACSYHKSWNPISKATDAEKKRKKSCKGFNSEAPATSYKKGSRLPNGGITTPGVASEVVTSAYTGEDVPFYGLGKHFYEAPTIPEVDYTGPTNIMPKSVMLSLLNAMRIITDTLGENLVLGKMIMCYSQLENGGAAKLGKLVIPNIIKIIEGFIIFVAGIMLIIAVGYYFLDISFKVGFSVLALPIAVALWPFEKTKDKIVTVLGVLMKASASFAFMALVTSYGVALISETLGDVSVLYEKIEQISKGASDTEIDALNDYIKDTIAIFSSTFIMLVFAMFYFYKLVSKTVDEIVGKFFKDGVFGNSNPMHETATKATGKAVNIAKTVTGFNLAKDVLSHQIGKRAKGLVNLAGKGAGSLAGKGVSKAGNAILHPARTAKNLVNKVRGKK